MQPRYMYEMSCYLLSENMSPACLRQYTSESARSRKAQVKSRRLRNGLSYHELTISQTVQYVYVRTVYLESDVNEHIGPISCPLPDGFFEGPGRCSRHE